MIISESMIANDTHTLVIKDKNNFMYKILMETSYENFSEELSALQLSNQKACIVCDSNTEPLYLNTLQMIVGKHVKSTISFTFPSGEGSKTLDTVQNLYECLIKAQFDRGDILIALGGGVVGDLTGYAAATYLRGIRFMQVPTTLLAMVDSSIGGKTGVDFRGYKNMVGAFYQPQSVYINLNTLKTLPKRVYYSGFGEVIKYALIGDRHFYDWLTSHSSKLLNYEESAVTTMVYRCCYHKQLTVEMDPTEKGERALLNLGHTIGHAIEKLKDFTLLHGECVAIGIVASCYMSMKRGYITSENLHEIEKLLQIYQLPIRTEGLDPESVLTATKSDKKMSSGQIKFILMDKMCHSIIDTTVTDNELIEAIRYILQ